MNQEEKDAILEKIHSLAISKLKWTYQNFRGNIVITSIYNDFKIELIKIEKHIWKVIITNVNINRPFEVACQDSYAFKTSPARKLFEFVDEQLDTQTYIDFIAQIP